MGDSAPGDVHAHDKRERMAVAETVEAEWMHAWQAGAPSAVRTALGMSQHRVGGGVALVMAHDPTGGYWNKALGFGVDEPFTGSVATEVIECYRSGGSRVAVLQVAPAALPEDWDDVCGRLGFVAGSSWVKLLRPTALDPAPSRTDLRIARVEPRDAPRWAEVFAAGFEMPQHPDLLSMFASALATPGSGFTGWGAWDGDDLVAAANLYLHGDAAAFCGAATLPEARGRGAQSAFFERRVEQAQQAGGAWCSAETWTEDPGHENPDLHHNPSLHNMRRAGFVDVYSRTNWVWRAPS